MLLLLILPYLAGYAALGIGYLAVGDTIWLLAFVVPTVVGTYLWTLGQV